MGRPPAPRRRMLRPRASRRGARGGALAVLLALILTAPAAGQGLAVPFVPQDPLLCGGAAAAMVLRWHGLRGVQPEDWAPLVRPEEGGIRTDELAGTFRERGWPVEAGPGDREGLALAVAAGRPPIVLLGEGRTRYHYVTVVGVEADTVRVHDPSHGPAVAIPWPTFERRWAATDRWMLVAEPPATRSTTGSPPASGHDASHDRGADRPADLLAHATDRFRAGDWAAAAAWAERATAAPGADPRAWRILAVSRYLDGQTRAALDAWARSGGLTLDLVRVEADGRTPVALLHRFTGLRPGTPLTAGSLARARRRVTLLPAAAASRVGYAPVDASTAEVEVVVVERPLLPGVPALAATGLRALARREASLTVASPLGLGEAATVAARWDAAAPRLAVAVAVPGVLDLPGVTTLSVEKRSERWADGRVQRHGRAALRHRDWLSGSVGWWAEAGVDRWEGAEASPSGASSGGSSATSAGDSAGDSPGHSSGHSPGGSLGAGLDWRPGGHTALDASAVLGWRSGDPSGPFTVAALDAAWRARDQPRGWVPSVRAGAAWASASAPRLLRPGAGTGALRPGLLRAHPLVRNGALGGPTLGRSLLTVGAELTRWTTAAGALPVGAAVFLDGAWAGARAFPASGAPLQADLGVGLRVRVPGTPGTLGLDAAVGLRDGATALSLGWRSAALD